jgi:hypothetical protein
MSSRLGQLQDEVSTRGGASLTSVIMVGPPALAVLRLSFWVRCLADVL